MIDIELSSLLPITSTIHTLEDRQLERDTTKAAATHLEGALEPYPQSTSVPGRWSMVTHKPMGFYERGRGWWYPVMERRTLGAGQRVLKSRGTRLAPKSQRGPGQVVGYKLSLQNQSERFQARWTIKYEDDGTTAIIGNNASYGPHLMGDDQAYMMALIGWHKARSIALAEWPVIRELAEQQVALHIAKRGT